jgi:chromosome segregation ATPase
MSTLKEKIQNKLSVMDLEKENLEKKIQDLENTIKEQDLTIHNTLENTIFRLRKENRALMSCNTKHCNTICDKERELVEIKQENKELITKIASLKNCDDEIQELKNKVQQLEKENDENKESLQKAIRDKNKLSDHLKMVLADNPIKELPIKKVNAPNAWNTSGSGLHYSMRF